MIDDDAPFSRASSKFMSAVPPIGGGPRTASGIIDFNVEGDDNDDDALGGDSLLTAPPPRDADADGDDKATELPTINGTGRGRGRAPPTISPSKGSRSRSGSSGGSGSSANPKSNGHTRSTSDSIPMRAMQSHSAAVAAVAAVAPAPKLPVVFRAGGASGGAGLISSGYWVSHSDDFEEGDGGYAPDTRLSGSGDSGHDKSQGHHHRAASDLFVAGQVHEHREMIAKQDAVLNEMAVAITRLQGMSSDIDTELDVHNAMLKELDEDMDATDARLQRVMKKVDSVLEKTGRPHWQIILCLSLLVIFLLFIIIYT